MQTLNVASVGSVGSYLLPQVFRAFLEENPASALTFHNYHSQEAYGYVADGLVDVALISDDIYHPQVETVPAFREPMLLVTGAASQWPEVVSPAQLDPAKELRLPWNPEYDLWHSFWFSSSAVPRAVLDQTSLLEDFFSWQGSWADSWAIAPAMVAHALEDRQGAKLHTLEQGPPDEIIYYLLGRRRKPELTCAFLSCLHRQLGGHRDLESYLGCFTGK
jgi:DNA-binding transcriptional LysR family regulator